MKKFTNKQQAFIIEYPVDFNATQAAIRAGYSRKTAYSIGHENLTKPEIWAAIERRMSEMAMSANEVLYRLGQQARVNIGSFLRKKVVKTEDGEEVVFDIDLEKVKEAGHLVKSLTWTKYGPKIELHDAQAALVHIGRHHKLFTDKVELTGWQRELLELINNGAITPADVEREFGADIAQEFFKGVGLVTVVEDANANADTE